MKESRQVKFPVALCEVPDIHLHGADRAPEGVWTLRKRYKKFSL